MMPTRQRILLVIYITLWSSATVLLFAVFDLSSLELLYIVSLAGFLAIIEATAPAELSVVWRRRLLWIAIAGIVGFALIAARAMISLLPSRYLPVHVLGFVL